MKVLVTGASGMVGRNITEHQGFFGYDMYTPSSSELDLLSMESVRDYLKSIQPEIIIHCAGKVGGIQANIQAPLEYLVTNIDMGRNLVLAAHETGVPRLLNLGSSCMYSNNHDEAIPESSLLSGPLEPTNEGYALAKIVVAKLCEYINRKEQFQYKTAIPCNVYGRYDNFNPSSSHFLAAIILKLQHAMENSLETVEIWGSGDARRELIYAQDLADFVFYACCNFNNMPELINVGTGYDHSINEYYAMAAEVLGYQGKFTHDKTRDEGMRRKLTDISKLNKFGWKARTELRAGIAETVDFYREHVDNG